MISDVNLEASHCSGEGWCLTEISLVTHTLRHDIGVMWLAHFIPVCNFKTTQESFLKQSSHSSFDHRLPLNKEIVFRAKKSTITIWFAKRSHIGSVVESLTSKFCQSSVSRRITHTERQDRVPVLPWVCRLLIYSPLGVRGLNKTFIKVNIEKTLGNGSL